LLARGYPIYGDFYPATESNDFANIYALGGFYNGTAPWVNSAATRVYLPWGLGQSYLNSNAAITNFMTFTTPYACRDMDLIYFDAAANSFTYTVDGGPTQTVTNTGASTIKKATAAMRGLANTTHTVVITSQSLANAAIINGMSIYTGLTSFNFGLGVGRLAYAGGLAGDYNTTGGLPVDRCYIMSGRGSGFTSTPFGFPTAPALAMIEIGLNDAINYLNPAITATGLVGPSGLRDCLRRLIEAVRIPGDSSVLLYAPQIADPAYSDTPTGVSFQVYDEFIEVMSTVAQTDRCAFYSAQRQFGQTSVASGLQQSTTDIHPSTAGHTLLANTILGVL
jgi:hypothetical protein